MQLLVERSPPPLNSVPSSVDLIHAPADKRALRSEEESDHVGRLVDRASPPERRRLIEGRIGRPAGMIPLLLHQGRVDRPGSDAVDAHLAMAILLSRGLGEAYETVLASIVCCVPGKT